MTNTNQLLSVRTLLATALAFSMLVLAAAPLITQADEAREPEVTVPGLNRGNTAPGQALLLPAIQKFVEQLPNRGIEPDEIDSKFVPELVRGLLLPAVQKAR